VSSEKPLHWNVKDLSGRQFGRWTVLQYAGKSHWLCRCQCGTERPVFTGALSGNKSLSCGCLRDEIVSQNSATHRLTKSAEYKVWAGVKRRCLNPNDKVYQAYGGSGVTICQRWSGSFEAFLSDMGLRPTARHTIERKDNSKGYEPGNCRWATRAEQNRNKSNNRPITLGAETKTLSEWAAALGVCHETIRYRLAAGWPIERALTTPAKLGRNQFSE
jgi:hypothetical protein